MLVSIVFACLYGLVFGSFANAVAYRVPTGETLWSRSHCPKCNAKITAWQNIPVLSWLFLRGKCANCKNPISIQYPAIELLTTVLFGLMAYSVSLMNFDLIPSILVTAVLCYFAFIGVVLSIIDLKEMKIPTILIYPTLIVSIVGLSVAALFMGDYSRILLMLVCGVGSFVIYYGIWWFFPKGFGFGDVRLSLLTGSILGWISVGHALIGLMLPFVLASVCLLPLLIAKVVTRKTKIPLGPWIILGTLVSVVVGDIVINWYLSVGGFL